MFLFIFDGNSDIDLSDQEDQDVVFTVSETYKDDIQDGQTVGVQAEQSSFTYDQSLSSRNRFYMLLNSIEFVNDLDVSDSDQKRPLLWRIRPLLRKVKQGCLSLPRTGLLHNLVLVTVQYTSMYWENLHQLD